MKFLFLIFFSLLIAGCNTENNSGNDNDVNDTNISELTDKYIVAWNSKDSAAIINFFDDNAIVMNDSSIFRGKQEIAKWVGGGVKVLSNIKTNSIKNNSNNNIAYDAGTYSLTITLPDLVLNEKGNYTSAWDKNGNWKITFFHIEDVTKSPDIK